MIGREGFRRRKATRWAAVVWATIVLMTALVAWLIAGGGHDSTPVPGTNASGARLVGPLGAGRSREAAHRSLQLAPGAALSAQVTVLSGARLRRVPRSFLGISTEYWALPVFERHMTELVRILRLLRVSGGGLLMLRVGGDSADHSLFDPDVRRLPRGVFDLTPAWLRRTGVLLRHVGARVLLDLNLASDLPLMAAQWARAAESELPAGTIAGFEVGNEPDLYNPSYWSEIFEPLERPLGIRLFKHELTPDEYIQLYRSYAHALARFAPRVPLAAPALAHPAAHRRWIRALLGAPHPELGIVTAHMYPYSGCVARTSSAYPTIGRVLSERATAGVARLLRPAIVLAHRAGYPFWLTELNSVTCGGLEGVSDTFATALWAPDVLFELLRAGVDGVNVHVRANAVNAAFLPTRDGIVARPLLYGLILFVRTLGPDAVLLGSRLTAPSASGLKAWVVRVRGGQLHVLVLNKGGRPAWVTLRLPAHGSASVQRLLAPSVWARSGETLDGQHLGPADTWQGRRDTHTIAIGAHGARLLVPAYSAALVEWAVGARRWPRTAATAERRGA